MPVGLASSKQLGCGFTFRLLGFSVVVDEPQIASVYLTGQEAWSSSTNSISVLKNVPMLTLYCSLRFRTWPPPRYFAGRKRPFRRSRWIVRRHPPPGECRAVHGRYRAHRGVCECRQVATV